MLDNFTETIAPDNRPLAIEEDIETIVRGATSTHLFKLPVDVEEIKDYKVSYKQGLNTIIEKGPNDCEIESLEIGVYIRSTITPADSRLFNDYNKSTFTQIAIMMQDDSIIYSNIYKLMVVDSINDDPFEDDEENE